jgi:hypothetical protein
MLGHNNQNQGQCNQSKKHGLPSQRQLRHCNHPHELGHWAKDCPYISQQEQTSEKRPLINAMGDEFQKIEISKTN